MRAATTGEDGGTWGRLTGWVAPAFAGMDPASAVIPVAASALLLLSRFHGNVRGFHRMFPEGIGWLPLPELQPHLYWFSASVLLYALVPLAIVAALPGERLRDYGLGLGDWRAGLKVSAVFFGVMLPTVLVAARFEVFGRTYPLDSDALRSWGHLAVYEAGYLAYFVGWELLFRSFLLFGMARRIGNQAIWVQLIPFVLMHAGKPEAEAFGSIVAGVALAVLALRTRSFWWGALLHGAVAVSMDLASAWGRVGQG